MSGSTAIAITGAFGQVGTVARIAARMAPSLTPALTDLLLADSVLTGGLPNAGDAFGVEPTPIERVWPGPDGAWA